MYLAEWVLYYTNQVAFCNLSFTLSLGNGIINKDFVDNHIYSRSSSLMFEIYMILFSNVYEKGYFNLNNILYYTMLNISVPYLL